MARFDPNVLSPDESSELMKEFFRAVCLLETYEETELFFHDLLTRKEIAMLARRLKIAAMLINGYSYSEIMESLGVWSNTITRVHRWLEVSQGGYVLIVKRLLKQNAKLTRERRALSSDFQKFKEKHPLHFWPAQASRLGVQKLAAGVKKAKKRKSISKS